MKARLIYEVNIFVCVDGHLFNNFSVESGCFPRLNQYWCTTFRRKPFP